MAAYYWVVLAALLLLIVAAIIYTVLFFRYRLALDHQPIGKTLVDMFSHVPDAGAGPASHVFAGTCFVAGTSSLVAAMLADALSARNEFIPNMVSTTGLLMTIAFSTVALWTLWQTRRIHYETGYKIFDFYDLIRVLNLEIRSLINSYNEVYSKRAQPFHRVYLVTTQPFLGRLSHSTKDITSDFLNNLRTLSDIRADSIKKHRNDNKLPTFDFQVLCGDAEAIKDFHTQFYGDRISAKELKEGIAGVEKEIRDLNSKVSGSDSGPFHRVPKIPPVQFMIVGTKLFEFTLEGQNSQSEIFNTQVVQDSRFCQKYIETFDILKGHLYHSNGGNEDNTGNVQKQS